MEVQHYVFHKLGESLDQVPVFIFSFNCGVCLNFVIYGQQNNMRDRRLTILQEAANMNSLNCSVDTINGICSYKGWEIEQVMSPMDRVSRTRGC